MLRTNYTTQSKSGVPALMKAQEIVSLLGAAQTDDELAIIELELSQARRDYTAKQWDWYAPGLWDLYTATSRRVAVMDLKNQRTYPDGNVRNN